jgi:hypothetical protein
MNKHHARLIYPSPFAHLDFDQELRVADTEGAARWGATPCPRDIAAALAATNGEWFEDFLAALADLSPNRALDVARVSERAQLRKERQ